MLGGPLEAAVCPAANRRSEALLEFRKSPRLAPLAIQVEFLHRGESRLGVLTNVSEGGAFLSTDQEFRVGDVLPVGIQLPEDFGEIRGEASVVWTSDRQSLRFFLLPCGAGLSFEQLGAEGRRRLRLFLTASAGEGRSQLGPLRPNGKRLFSRRATR